MIRSGLAKTARRISRSSTWRRCAPCRICACSARRTRWRRRNAGNWRWTNRTGPTVLALSRQNLSPLRTVADADNLRAMAAIDWWPRKATPRRLRCVWLGGRARRRRAEGACRGRGIATRVGVDSFARTAAGATEIAAQRGSLAAPREIAIEAAVRFGWDAVIGPDGIFIGMKTLRRQRAGQGALHDFWNHGRGGGRGGLQLLNVK